MADDALPRGINVHQWCRPSRKRIQRPNDSRRSHVLVSSPDPLSCLLQHRVAIGDSSTATEAALVNDRGVPVGRASQPASQADYKRASSPHIVGWIERELGGEGHAGAEAEWVPLKPRV
jgi:hypothetical protein